MLNLFITMYFSCLYNNLEKFKKNENSNLTPELFSIAFLCMCKNTQECCP